MIKSEKNKDEQRPTAVCMRGSYQKKRLTKRQEKRLMHTASRRPTSLLLVTYHTREHG